MILQMQTKIVVWSIIVNRKSTSYSFVTWFLRTQQNVNYNIKILKRYFSKVKCQNSSQSIMKITYNTAFYRFISTYVPYLRLLKCGKSQHVILKFGAWKNVEKKIQLLQDHEYYKIKQNVLCNLDATRLMWLYNRKKIWIKQFHI